MRETGEVDLRGSGFAGRATIASMGRGILVGRIEVGEEVRVGGELRECGPREAQVGRHQLNGLTGIERRIFRIMNGVVVACRQKTDDRWKT